MHETEERFFWVRDKGDGKVSVGRRFRMQWLSDAIKRDPEWMWEVMLPGWHDYENQAYFDEVCEILAEIPRLETS